MRFTPTCVGKTPRACRRAGTRAVHPHMRGEDSVSRYRISANGGSPPHAWGRQLLVVVRVEDRRFTPTCVGKTWRRHCAIHVSAVHPHMRGEDATVAPSANSSSGSPPHAWGRRDILQDCLAQHRFTPTCVGKTCAYDQVIGSSCGSPPHAWGRRGPVWWGQMMRRFTPTCVGKTRGGRDRVRVDPVHPHMRGEDGWSGCSCV